MKKLILALATLALTSAYLPAQGFDHEMSHSHSHSHSPSEDGTQGPRGPRGHRGHRGPTGATGAPGVIGATGATGATGVSNLSSYFTYNDAGLLTVTLAAGEAVPFNQAGIDVGSSVVHNNVGTPTDFTIVEPGTYLVLFNANTALVSLLGGVQFEVDGIPVGSTSTLVSAGVPLVLQSLIQVPTAPVTLTVVATGLGVTLSSGTSAQISITRVNSGL